MKNFILGFVLGAILASALTAYAASTLMLVDGRGLAVGLENNPIHVIAV